MLSAPSLADVNLCDLYSLTCQQLYHLAWVDVFVQNGRMPIWPAFNAMLRFFFDRSEL